MLEIDANNPYLVVVSGSCAGNGFIIENPPVTIGRKGTMIIPDPEDKNISRLHATIELVDDDLYIADNQSTNGTMVNGRKIERQMIRGGDKISIGSSTMKLIHPQKQKMLDQVSDRAHIDELTGLYNKDRFDEMLAVSIAEAYLFQSPLGVLYIDVDNFRKTNNDHGREFGHRTLIELSELLSSLLLEDQELFRVKGDQFTVLLRGPSARFAMDIGELIRQAVEVFNFKYDDQNTSLTVSVGVNFLEGGSITTKQACGVFDKAKEGVAQAKELGGNKVLGESNIQR